MAQTQSQKMSQTQIMSLNILAMSSADLRTEIYSQIAKNPALELKSDSLESGISSSHTTVSNFSKFSDNTHYARTSSSGELASDNFQAALESNADTRESLSDHLLHQLYSLKLTDEERFLCEKLIYNLDEKGFHILAPISFLNPENPLHTDEFLSRCLHIVQNFDPVGTCTDNFRQSLFVQAKISGKASRLTLFLLEANDHFEFLNPPQIQKIQKKLSEFYAGRQKLKFQESQEFSISKEDFTQEEIQHSLDFIKTLEPYPARNFGKSEAHFIAPDVIVSKNPNAESGEDEFLVSFAREFLPRLEISKNYTDLIKSADIKDGDTGIKSERQKAELKFVRHSVNEAKVFIDSVLYRESTILKAAREIVSVQSEFFKRGAKFLVPLRQKDIAEKLSVHEATISRMANSKYISCEWGIFPVSYFFTNALTAPNSSSESKSSDSPLLSKESVKYEISQILEEHKNDKKALSDQKISDILAVKGIKIARRTVAKYRTELNVNSSYER